MECMNMLYFTIYTRIASLETCAKSINNKKLSCRKETVRLLRGSVSAKM